MAKFALPCIVISISAECYWYLVEYEHIPSIHWYNIIICLNLLTRYLLFSRIEFTESLFGQSAQSINLDWLVYQITRFYILMEMLNVTEYLLRHLAQLTQVQFIYDLYPYAMQSIATFTLWIVFNESHKLIKSRFINA